MTNLRRFLTLSAFLSLSTMSVAYAGTFTAGEYKLALGSAAPCTVTLAADGTVSTGTCVAASSVGHWQQHGSTLELSKGSGEIYALLKLKGDAYTGATIPANHTLTLTPTAQTAAVGH